MDDFEHFSPADFEHLIIQQGKNVTAGFLSSGAHHEYKNFLTQIELCSHYGLSAESVAEKNEALSMIQEYIEQAHETVTWLLEYISREKDRNASGWLFSGELDRCFDAIRYRCRRRTIVFNVQRCSECKILIDKYELYQVILTLAQYVFSARPEHAAAINGGEISLTEHKLDNRYMLDLVYTCCNASDKEYRSPFCPSPNNDDAGGLYLYIARKLVNEAGGALTHKEAGEQAGFYLILPLGAV